MTAEIIVVGSELLTPFRQDTNSLYLTEKLNQLGVDVCCKTIVADDQTQIAAITRLALTRADIILFSGGLGPTEDDLTREGVAEALQLQIHRDTDLLATFEARAVARGWKMTSNNHKQADVLSGAVVLANSNGTAPGQWISTKHNGRERILILLPGPPHELKSIFEEQCLDRLRTVLPEKFIVTRVLKITGIGESQCDARVAPIYKRYTDVQTTILAGAGEIQLHLKTSAAAREIGQQRVDQLVEEIENELQDLVFSDTGESLEHIVNLYLQMRNASLAVAESCTGGLVAERLTSISGSSRYFLGGAVVYSNELKTKFADVPSELIEKHGAVSEEVARALAEGIRKRCGATYGVGITGIAGPTGGSAEKPVGLVFHALSWDGGTEVMRRIFPGDRKHIRWYASQIALDMVRRKMM